MSDATSEKRKSQAFGGVDFVGLALDLEEREKTVESQTTKRAMSAAAHGLRLMGAEIERIRADACVWHHGDANDTMRHPEQSDLTGGATDNVLARWRNAGH